MDIKGYSKHISQQFNLELDKVKTHLLEMGGVVERQVESSVAALVEGDSGAAQEVRETDKSVNFMEVSIDEECARILARRQPAAGDLRLVIAISKVTTDLERIGDEAGKIAKLAILLSEDATVVKGYMEIRHIGQRVATMLHDALDSFARLDAQRALLVAREDRTVDREYKSAMRDMVEYMMEDPRQISRSLNIIWALRSLERIGDHSRNIAEHVIYLVKGKDVRHIGLKAMAAQVDDEADT
jgi:phosphate transport system protein